MKKNYKKMQEFVDELMTEESIKIARESSFCDSSNSEYPFCLEEFSYIVEDLKDYEYSSYKTKSLKVPFIVVDYIADSDTDHDHGAWTDTYVIDVDGRFYEVEFDFYGQGDFDDTKHRGVREVFAKEVTKTVYE